MALPVITPVQPDFHYCDPLYGRNIHPVDCVVAASRLAEGSASAVPYFLNVPGARFTLPISLNHGTCFISIEAAGPSIEAALAVRSPPPALVVIPREFRGMAGWVNEKCVTESGGIGGFVTHSLINLIHYTVRPGTSPMAAYPFSSAFTTLTITGPNANRKFSPGDNDPLIPLMLSGFEDAAKRASGPHTADYYTHIAHGLYWRNQAARMSHGGNKHWWGLSDNPTTDKMTYECDEGLGRPKQTDCTHIKWDLLGPASDSFTVGPGITTFLHQSSCFLAISASIQMVLTWQQIRTAVDTLMNVCIGHPYQTPRGGRAFFRQAPGISRRFGIGRRDTLTGLNALPPHANITIFKQTETWKSAEDELKSCTWKAVASGKSVSTCDIA